MALSSASESVQSRLVSGSVSEGCAVYDVLLTSSSMAETGPECRAAPFSTRLIMGFRGHMIADRARLWAFTGRIIVSRWSLPMKECIISAEVSDRKSGVEVGECE